MTWIDIFPIALIVVYGAGGFFSGLIRRFIGLVALFVAVWAATNLGLQAGGILQQTSVVLNRTLGTALGLITAILLSVVLVYELGQAANPIGGAQLDPTQQGLRDSVHRSAFMVSLVNAIDRPIIALFQPLLPGDPQIYFGPGPVNP
ncbi:MAG: hypothetical protein AUI15_37155 [Actinobacteria bacterium 13_2_20CM_2_66_6]|nr:MAG: hypothetical protein AUI15_37155 [Actinobacteria bacterium 13_2_20CM_2_66_6]